MYKSRTQRGYTLIEILVVVFIISIVTTVALLSISQNENKHIEAFANELTQVMTFAEEQAMLQPVVLGVSLSDKSVNFSGWQPNADSKKSAWIPLESSALQQRSVPSDIELTVAGHEDNAADNAKQPQIIISTNGDPTPFTIYVGKKGAKPRYVITGDTDGNITNRLLS